MFWIVIIILIFIVVLLKYFEQKLYINKQISEMSAELEKKGGSKHFRVLRGGKINDNYNDYWFNS